MCVVCSTCLKNTHLVEGYLHHCDGGSYQLDGAHRAYMIAVEVAPVDSQGSRLGTIVVGEDCVWGLGMRSSIWF